jgi:hypothetical protein
MPSNNSNNIEAYFTSDEATVDLPCEHIDQTTCCGLFELHGINPNDQVAINKFIFIMRTWASQVEGKESRDGFFTHIRDSKLYKTLKTRRPAGIKIVHEWTNANTGRELFMAIVSPVYNKTRKQVKKLAAPKKRAVRK